MVKILTIPIEFYDDWDYIPPFWSLLAMSIAVEEGEKGGTPSKRGAQTKMF